MSSGIITVLHSQRLPLLATCNPGSVQTEAPREERIDLEKRRWSRRPYTSLKMRSINWRRVKGVDWSKDVMVKVIYSKGGYLCQEITP